MSELSSVEEMEEMEETQGLVVEEATVLFEGSNPEDLSWAEVCQGEAETETHQEVEADPQEVETDPQEEETHTN